jgi:hypothetical protein
MGETPTVSQELQAEIAETRAGLADTAEALAAKTDVKARTKEAAAGVADNVKAQAGKVAGRAGEVAGQTRDQISTRAAALRESAGDFDVPAAVRKPVPIAAIAGVIALAVAGIVIWRRRR